jgi:hypothetical protein
MFTGHKCEQELEYQKPVLILPVVMVMNDVLHFLFQEQARLWPTPPCYLGSDLMTPRSR